VRECVKMSIPQGTLLTSLAQMVITTFSSVYESITKNADKILEEIAREEDKFSKTLTDGTREFEKIVR
jgi:alanyl-tRNA synthetase